MSGDSTRKRRPRKAADRPKKPYPDFPLSPHLSGAWQKKIRGKIHYFGRWGRMVNGKLKQLPGDDWWKSALELYLEQRDDLQAGRTPRTKSEGLTVADLCNRFLTVKLRQQEVGELTKRSFLEYREATDLIVASFGKTRRVDDLAADDFETLRDQMARRWGPHRLAGTIQRIRTLFKYGYEAGLMDRPVRFGPAFKKPSKRVMRCHKAQAGPRMFEADELRQLLSAAKPQLRAMILLGINAGFGDSDCGRLPLRVLDLDRGWVSFPRGKTGIDRRAPLWPETVEALKEVLAKRREPKDPAVAGLAFITKYGQARFKETGTTASPISAEMRKLLNFRGLHRPGVGFYALRHTFETIGGEVKDQVAVDHIMGHAREDMASVYRERISDTRLQAVVNHVRTWLFGDTPSNGTTEPQIGDPEASEPTAEMPQQVTNNSSPVLRLYVG